jgi:hypothetical protein
MGNRFKQNVQHSLVISILKPNACSNHKELSNMGPTLAGMNGDSDRMYSTVYHEMSPVFRVASVRRNLFSFSVEAGEEVCTLLNKRLLNTSDKTTSKNKKVKLSKCEFEKESKSLSSNMVSDDLFCCFSASKEHSTSFDEKIENCFPFLIPSQILLYLEDDCEFKGFEFESESNQSDEKEINYRLSCSQPLHYSSFSTRPNKFPTPSKSKSFKLSRFTSPSHKCIECSNDDDHFTSSERSKIASHASSASDFDDEEEFIDLFLSPPILFNKFESSFPDSIDKIRLTL